ncbi:hypothetical protein CAPTEDRAFT_218351 [Capitella teleta]|uniref:Cytochrome P450 n=1 Tax=Capitella teleta TaxID=283909 RepID=R7ULE6_CAPTE|nr:hypothetical protein CAPTEDRAFT_218351 [Capitella teleta]|eukprot:ELU06918.1 hypothetical protein CAPTEDRAFT_218351 [Capitella teleta]
MWATQIRSNAAKASISCISVNTQNNRYLSACARLADDHEYLPVTFDERHLKKQARWSELFDGLFSYCIGLYVCMELSHPSPLSKLLSTAEPKDRISYRTIKPWIGDGLLVSSGEKWARNRRLLTPAFHFDVLKPYVGIFSSTANIMADKWRKILSKNDEPLEMFQHVSLMTLDSLLKCIFGQTGSVQNEGRDGSYIRSVYQLTELVMKRFQFFPYLIDWIYYFTPSALQVSPMLQHCPRILALDSDGRGLTDEEIQHEVDTFMFEGHDTTASGLSWCLYNLARHPEYQDRCRKEVMDVMGDRSDVEWDDMSKLTFLTMCIKESLRLHPAVPNIGRSLTKPMTFPDGRTVPAETDLGIAIYGCHHNSALWENPEQYDPERFNAENSKDRPPHSFIPFSAGPRNCIGQHFAMHEMRSVLAVCLKNFQLRIDDTRILELLPQLVLKAKGGLWLKVTPIE